MQEVRQSGEVVAKKEHGQERGHDILFLTVMVPFSVSCFVAFFSGEQWFDDARRTIFLLAPMIVGGVWIAYEQMHDLVWWKIHPLCPTCRRSFPVAQQPRAGMICDCCDKPLYPLQTPQDYKVIILVTAITVIALPVFALWATLITRLS